MRTEIRYASHPSNRIADRFNRFQQIAFIIVFHKTDNVDSMVLRKNPDVVIHAYPASMHMEHGWIRRQHQNVHDCDRISTSLSVTSASGAENLLRSAIGSRPNAR